jgi:hypothetical protein
MRKTKTPRSTTPSARTRANSIQNRRALDRDWQTGTDRHVARTLQAWNVKRDRHIARADQHLAKAGALDDRMHELLRAWTQ